MRRILHLCLCVLLSSCQGPIAYAVSNETLNAKDPNYNIELNDLLQQISASVTQLSYNNLSNLTGLVPTNRGGTGKDSSNWTSGDLIYMSATGTWNHGAVDNFFVPNAQFFTASGTFTAPAGVVTVYITMVGGGASGGGSNNVGQGGGGGSSGDWIINYPYTVVPGNSYTVTVGAGGAISTGGGVGNNGGTTTFDTISVSGGNAGHEGTGSLNGGSAPVGLNASTSVSTSAQNGGLAQIQGGNGAKGTTAGPGGVGGGGGASIFGAGGNGGNVSNNGQDAPVANSGAGGGGAGGSNTTLILNSGKGADGFVFLQLGTSGTSGGGGGTTYTTAAFTNASLVTGKLTIAHSKGTKPFAIVFTNSSGKQVFPDLTFNNNSLVADLSSFGSISGTWHYAYL